MLRARGMLLHPQFGVGAFVLLGLVDERIDARIVSFERSLAIHRAGVELDRCLDLPMTQHFLDGRVIAGMAPQVQIATQVPKLMWRDPYAGVA